MPMITIAKTLLFLRERPRAGFEVEGMEEVLTRLANRGAVRHEPESQYFRHKIRPWLNIWYITKSGLRWLERHGLSSTYPPPGAQ